MRILTLISLLLISVLCTQAQELDRITYTQFEDGNLIQKETYQVSYEQGKLKSLDMSYDSEADSNSYSCYSFDDGYLIKVEKNINKYRKRIRGPHCLGPVHRNDIFTIEYDEQNRINKYRRIYEERWDQLYTVEYKSDTSDVAMTYYSQYDSYEDNSYNMQAYDENGLVTQVIRIYAPGVTLVTEKFETTALANPLYTGCDYYISDGWYEIHGFDFFNKYMWLSHNDYTYKNKVDEQGRIVKVTAMHKGKRVGVTEYFYK